MKKAALFLLVILLILSGCSQAELTVTGHDWVFSSAQSRIDGAIVAEYPEVNVELTATATQLTLKVGEQEHIFSYSDPERSPETVVYSVGEDGAALVGITEFYDGEKQYEKFTLILTLKGYNLTFYAE